MAKDIAVAIHNLSKDFLLPHERKNSLKEWVLHFRKPTYERMHALQDIDFEVKRGEFFGIVGRNGSGKSTLLKLIGGIYQPTKGSVTVNGTLTPFIELGIGFNPELTGRENVYLNGAILGLTRREIEAKYQEIVDFAELEKFMDQKLKNYSSGMQVRLAFSIAMQAHNDILLIDEVLAVGDASFQRKCFKIFKNIKKSDKTVIFVTHDMGAVEAFCDRAIMIQDSKMVEIGSPRNISRRYELANSPNVEAAATKEKKLQRPADPAIRITGLRLLQDGKPSANFSVKDDITAEITVETREPIAVQMNVFILQSDGRYFCGINSTKDLGVDFKPVRGTQTIICKIDAGQLVYGEYELGVGIYTPGWTPEIVDVMDKAYEAKLPKLNIVDRSKFQDGEFYVRGSWQG